MRTTSCCWTRPVHWSLYRKDYQVHKETQTLFSLRYQYFWPSLRVWRKYERNISWFVFEIIPPRECPDYQNVNNLINFCESHLKTDRVELGLTKLVSDLLSPASFSRFVWGAKGSSLVFLKYFLFSYLLNISLWAVCFFPFRNIPFPVLCGGLTASTGPGVINQLCWSSKSRRLGTLRAARPDLGPDWW